MNRRTLLRASIPTLTVTALGARLAVASTPEVASPEHSPPVIAPEMSGEDPLMAAEYLSSLEAIQHVPALYELYGYIHPDAAEIVPRATVIDWYQEDFQPMGPKRAVATGVEYLESWAWEVTGQSYQNVAEVTYTQEFANADPVEDVVRLVYLNGCWRWWFGRDLAFVEAQNERFADVFEVPEEGNAPGGLDSIAAIDDTLLGQLPATIEDSQLEATFELRETAGSWDPFSILKPMQMFSYSPVDGETAEYPIGSVYYGSVEDGYTDAEVIVVLAEDVHNAPPAEIVAWNSSPESGPAWLQSYSPGAEMGPSFTMKLVLNGMFMQFSLHSEETFDAVIAGLSNTP